MGIGSLSMVVLLYNARIALPEIHHRSSTTYYHIQHHDIFLD